MILFWLTPYIVFTYFVQGFARTAGKHCLTANTASLWTSYQREEQSFSWTKRTLKRESLKSCLLQYSPGKMWTDQRNTPPKSSGILIAKPRNGSTRTIGKLIHAHISAAMTKIKSKACWELCT